MKALGGQHEVNVYLNVQSESLRWTVQGELNTVDSANYATDSFKQDMLYLI